MLFIFGCKILIYKVATKKKTAKLLSPNTKTTKYYVTFFRKYILIDRYLSEKGYIFYLFT